MILNFIEKLQLDKYGPESPDYMKYAEKVYDHAKNENGSKLSEVLHHPDYKTFLDSLKSDISKNMDSLEVDPKLNVNPDDYSNFYKTLLNFPKIIDILNDIIQKNKKEELIILFLHLIVLIEIHIKTVISIQNKKLIVEKSDITEFADRKVRFNQSEIAKEEYNVDKDTFRKWIETLYGEYIYKGRKTLKLSEYIETSKDLLIGKTENQDPESEYLLDINHFEEYSSMLSEGTTYSKEKIVELGFILDEEPTPREYSEANKILAKEFTSHSMKKLPASIANKMIDVLKEKS